MFSLSDIFLDSHVKYRSIMRQCCSVEDSRWCITWTIAISSYIQTWGKDVAGTRDKMAEAVAFFLLCEN